MSKVVGQSKIYMNFRVSIFELRNLLDVKEGDRVMFIEELNGNITLKKMKP